MKEEVVADVPAESVIVTEDWEARAHFTERTCIWTGDNRLAGAKIASYQNKPIVVSEKFKPISANPKVRDLQYIISVMRKEEGLDSFLAMKRKEEKFGESVDFRCKYLLCEFVEENGRQLAELYNPYDKEQQEKFGDLVREYFDPRLAEYGCKVKDASFRKG